MSIATTNLSGIKWAAINRARQYYREQYGPQSSPEHYQDWMLHEWGIIHIHGIGMRVDDDVKYTAFLLRWA